MKKISERTIHRLILYRKLLKRQKNESVANVFSHNIASLAGITPAQVRRDLMVVGYDGSTVLGYNVKDLLKSIDTFLDNQKVQNVALVGLGKLGRALLDYSFGKNPRIKIAASFDSDPKKVNMTINGCNCYHIDELESIIKKLNISVAILSVPSSQAQLMAERLVGAGISGILNYTHERLYLDEKVYVEYKDMMMSLEKVVYFANQLKKS